MSDENNRDSVFRLLEETLAANLALQSVCATLMVEVAILNKAPRDKLASMVAGMQGVANGVAKQSGLERGTPAITKTIDLICTMAEASLKGPPDAY